MKMVDGKIKKEIIIIQKEFYKKLLTGIQMIKMIKIFQMNRNFRSFKKCWMMIQKLKNKRKKIRIKVKNKLKKMWNRIIKLKLLNSYKIINKKNK
jgi:hypothetical protein